VRVRWVQQILRDCWLVLAGVRNRVILGAKARFFGPPRRASTVTPHISAHRGSQMPAPPSSMPAVGLVHGEAYGLDCIRCAALTVHACVAWR
jgi:hypothetical protein